MRPIADDDERWLDRAAEARAYADVLDDPEMKSMMLEIAEQYDGLATRARERVKKVNKDQT